MKKLLARKGFSVITVTDEEGIDSQYFYSPAMLKERIFVVLTASESYFGEDEEGEGEGEDAPEYETAIKVLWLKDAVAYDFTITVDDRPVIPVLYLYGMIVDVLEIISTTGMDELYDCLSEVSTGVDSTDEYEDKELRNHTYNLVVTEIGRAVAAISGKL